MARERNYAAEYAARNQRSYNDYGISYNQQRSVVNFTSDLGMSPKATRGMLSEITDFVDNVIDTARDIAGFLDDVRNGDMDFQDLLDWLEEQGIEIDPDNIPDWLWYN